MSFFFIFFFIRSFKPRPQFLKDDDRQRHSEQHAALCQKERDQGISPAKVIADRIILWQVVQEIKKSLSLRPVITKEPDESKAAAKKQKPRRDLTRQTIAGQPKDEPLENHQQRKCPSDVLDYHRTPHVGAELHK